MAAKLTRPTWKIVILWHLMVGSCIIYLLLSTLVVSLETLGYAFVCTISYMQTLNQSVTVQSFNFYQLFGPQVKML